MSYFKRNSYRIVNPAAGNDYFDTSDTAITESTQPKVDGGASARPFVSGTSTARSPDNLDASPIDRSQGDIYGSQLTADLAGGSGQGTTAISGRNFAQMVAGQYIMRRGGANTEYLAGTSGFTTLRSGASDYGIRRSINARTIVRGPLTATSIRRGDWNIFSGVFEITGVLTPPTSSTDGLGNVSGQTGATQTLANATGADQAVFHPSGYDYPGELVYVAGNSSTILIPKQDDYKKRTTN
jgi:hypothetical protein